MEDIFTIYCKNLALQEKKEVLINIPYFYALFSNNWPQLENDEIDLNFKSINPLSVIKVIDYYKKKEIQFNIYDVETLNILGFDKNQLPFKDEFNQTQQNIDEFNKNISTEMIQFTDDTIIEDNIPQNDIVDSENNILKSADITLYKRYFQYSLESNNNFELVKHKNFLYSSTIYIKLPALSNGLYYKNKVILQLFNDLKILVTGYTIFNYPIEVLEFYSKINKDDFNLFDYPLELRKVLSKNEYVCKITLKYLNRLNTSLCYLTYFKYSFQSNFNLIENSDTLINKNDIKISICNIYGSISDFQIKDYFRNYPFQQLTLSTNKIPIMKNNDNRYRLLLDPIPLGIYDIIIKTDESLIEPDIVQIMIYDKDNTPKILSKDLLRIYNNFYQIKIPNELKYINRHHQFVNFNYIYIDFQLEKEVKMIAFKRFYNYLRYAGGVMGTAYRI